MSSEWMKTYARLQTANASIHAKLFANVFENQLDPTKKQEMMESVWLELMKNNQQFAELIGIQAWIYVVDQIPPQITAPAEAARKARPRSSPPVQREHVRSEGQQSNNVATHTKEKCRATITKLQAVGQKFNVVSKAPKKSSSVTPLTSFVSPRSAVPRSAVNGNVRQDARRNFKFQSSRSMPRLTPAPPRFFGPRKKLNADEGRDLSQLPAADGSMNQHESSTFNLSQPSSAAMNDSRNVKCPDKKLKCFGKKENNSDVVRAHTILMCSENAEVQGARAMPTWISDPRQSFIAYGLKGAEEKHLNQPRLAVDSIERPDENIKFRGQKFVKELRRAQPSSIGNVSDKLRERTKFMCCENSAMKKKNAFIPRRAANEHDVLSAALKWRKYVQHVRELNVVGSSALKFSNKLAAATSSRGWPGSSMATSSPRPIHGRIYGVAVATENDETKNVANENVGESPTDVTAKVVSDKSSGHPAPQEAMKKLAELENYEFADEEETSVWNALMPITTPIRPTAQVTVYGNTRSRKGRALFDTGSTINIISNQLASDLKLKITDVYIEVRDFEGKLKEPFTKQVVIKMRGENGNSFQCLALVGKVLTSCGTNLPNETRERLARLAGPQADPALGVVSPIDIIIGTDTFQRMSAGSLPVQNFPTLTAHFTVFGRVYSGSVPSTACDHGSQEVAVAVISAQELCHLPQHDDGREGIVEYHGTLPLGQVESTWFIGHEMTVEYFEGLKLTVNNFPRVPTEARSSSTAVEFCIAAYANQTSQKIIVDLLPSLEADSKRQSLHRLFVTIGGRPAKLYALNNKREKYVGLALVTEATKFLRETLQAGDLRRGTFVNFVEAIKQVQCHTNARHCPTPVPLSLIPPWEKVELSFETELETETRKQHGLGPEPTGERSYVGMIKQQLPTSSRNVRVRDLEELDDAESAEDEMPTQRVVSMSVAAADTRNTLEQNVWQRDTADLRHSLTIAREKRHQQSLKIEVKPEAGKRAPKVFSAGGDGVKFAEAIDLRKLLKDARMKKAQDVVCAYRAPHGPLVAVRPKTYGEDQVPRDINVICHHLMCGLVHCLSTKTDAFFLTYVRYVTFVPVFTRQFVAHASRSKIVLMLFICRLTGSIEVHALTNLRDLGNNMEKVTTDFWNRHRSRQILFPTNLRRTRFEERTAMNVNERNAYESIEQALQVGLSNLITLFTGHRAKIIDHEQFDIDAVEREGGITTLLMSLNRALRRSNMNADELQRFSMWATAALNTRPLCARERQDGSVVVLTPMHFLQGLKDLWPLQFLETSVKLEEAMRLWWEEWRPAYGTYLRSLEHREPAKNGTVCIVEDPGFRMPLWHQKMITSLNVDENENLHKVTGSLGVENEYLESLLICLPVIRIVNAAEYELESKPAPQKPDHDDRPRDHPSTSKENCFSGESVSAISTTAWRNTSSSGMDCLFCQRPTHQTRNCPEFWAEENPQQKWKMVQKHNICGNCINEPFLGRKCVIESGPACDTCKGGKHIAELCKAAKRSTINAEPNGKFQMKSRDDKSSQRILQAEELPQAQGRGRKKKFTYEAIAQNAIARWKERVFRKKVEELAWKQLKEPRSNKHAEHCKLEFIREESNLQPLLRDLASFHRSVDLPHPNPNYVKAHELGRLRRLITNQLEKMKPMLQYNTCETCILYNLDYVRLKEHEREFRDAYLTRLEYVVDGHEAKKRQEAQNDQQPEESPLPLGEGSVSDEPRPPVTTPVTAISAPRKSWVEIMEDEEREDEAAAAATPAEGGKADTETAPPIIVEDPEESIVEDPEESIVEDPEESIVEDPEESIVEDPEESIVEDPDEYTDEDPEDSDEEEEFNEVASTSTINALPRCTYCPEGKRCYHCQWATASQLPTRDEQLKSLIEIVREMPNGPPPLETELIEQVITEDRTEATQAALWMSERRVVATRAVMLMSERSHTAAAAIKRSLKDATRRGLEKVLMWVEEM